MSLGRLVMVLAMLFYAKDACAAIRGEIGIWERYFFNAAEVSEEVEHETIARFEPDIQFDWHWQRSGSQRHNADTGRSKLWPTSIDMKINPEMYTNLNVQSQKRFDSGDSYIGLHWEVADLRLGSMEIHNGSTESQNLVDVFNQKDYELDFLDAPKLGELGAKLSMDVAQVTWDFLLFPCFKPAPLPGVENRFNLFPGIDDLGDHNQYSDTQEKKRYQTGMRLRFTIGTADIRFTYFDGYNKLPAFFWDVPAATMGTFYYEEQLYGLDLQWAISQWVIKVESVYRDTGSSGDHFRYVRDDQGVRMVNVVPESDLASVAGFEYALPAFFGHQDLLLFMEYLYSSDRKPEAPIYRPFGNDAFMAIKWLLNDTRNTVVELGGIYDLDDHSYITRLELQSTVMRSLRINIRWDQINADPDNPLYYFDRDDHLLLKLDYLF